MTNAPYEQFDHVRFSSDLSYAGGYVKRAMKNKELTAKWLRPSLMVSRELNSIAMASASQYLASNVAANEVKLNQTGDIIGQKYDRVPTTELGNLKAQNKKDRRAVRNANKLEVSSQILNTGKLAPGTKINRGFDDNAGKVKSTKG